MIDNANNSYITISHNNLSMQLNNNAPYQIHIESAPHSWLTLRCTIFLGACQIPHPKIPYHTFAEVTDLMSVWTSTFCWNWVLADVSVIVLFLHRVVALFILLLNPILFLFTLQTSAHNIFIECRSLGYSCFL